MKYDIIACFTCCLLDYAYLWKRLKTIKYSFTNTIEIKSSASTLFCNIFFTFIFTNIFHFCLSDKYTIFNMIYIVSVVIKTQLWCNVISHNVVFDVKNAEIFFTTVATLRRLNNLYWVLKNCSYIFRMVKNRRI